jgi:Tol biopolymer transport system component
MALEAGNKLGPYEILGGVGAGGMGEVYRAKDTRLDRIVAIKVLPGDRSADEGARARFDREARSLSGLTHPNICALYDVGHEGGVDYLVMEYLEGETLQDRVLREGALPTAQLVGIGSQIADALAVAHRQGFVHRDLKPANVMLTRTGAKLLDFGLAKSLETQDPSAGLTASPTATSPLTAAGQIVGTFQYMAPEQLEGKEADARSDIFALGAVLYEMATGARAFEGDNQASLIASIMKEDPRLVSALAPTSPPALDLLVQRCLAKNPDDRWQSASDLAHGLRALQAESVTAASAVAVAPTLAARPSKLPWTLAGLFCVVAIALAVMLLRGPEETAAPPVRFRMPPPDDAIFRTTGDEAAPVAVSPDGGMLVFGTFESSGANRLWVRALDDLEARPLPGTEGGIRPFWSPDGRFIGFFTEGKLKKIEIAGGPALPLTDVTEPRGGTWNRDGIIVYAPGAAGGLLRISADGGTAEPLTELTEEEGSHRYPHFLPDGRHIVYLALTAKGASGTGLESNNKVYAVSLDGDAPRMLLQGAANAEFAGGRLVFYRGGQLVTRPLDPGTLAVADDLETLANDVQYDASYERGLFSVSNRVLAYHAGDFRGKSILQWYERDGTPGEVVGEEMIVRDVRISPDGRYLAYCALEGAESDMWVEDIQRRQRTRITFEDEENAAPAWSPDGRFLLYSRTEGADWVLYRKPVSGSGDAERLLGMEGSDISPMHWSPDGRYLVVTVTGNSDDLWAVRVDEQGNLEGDPFALKNSPTHAELWPRISPDGRWLAYSSNESGRWEVYVTSFPAGQGKWQVSQSGGMEAIWRDDGRALFFRSTANTMMVAQVTARDDRFEIGTVESLFHVYSLSDMDGFNYDVTPGGERFLVNTIAEEQARAPLTVVLDW